MIFIESKENSIIKEIKKLKDKKGRKEEQNFIIEGLRFCEEAISAKVEIKYIVYSEKIEDKIQDLLKELNSEVKIIKTTHNILKTLCNTDNPQGILGVVPMNISKQADEKGLYILVDKVQDPGNLGTIIRSAHGSGAKGVILTKGTVDPFNDKTLRSTMGSIFKIPIIEDDEALSLLKELKDKGFSIVVSSLQTEYNFYDVDLCGNSVICVGNEGNGISDEVYNNSTVKVKIPMPGGAESLNVAVAASIMMFEAVRQKSLSSNK